MMKTISALAAAGMIAVGAIAVPAPAQARNNAGAVAAGVIGGLAVGAIIGSAASRGAYDYYPPPAPVYYGPYRYYHGCHWVRERVWINHRPRWHNVRVCE
jgi:hypothetical protein